MAYVKQPYLWGGRGSNSGFACSRLLAVVQVVWEPASNACACSICLSATLPNDTQPSA